MVYINLRNQFRANRELLKTNPQINNSEDAQGKQETCTNNQLQNSAIPSVELDVSENILALQNQALINVKSNALDPKSETQRHPKTSTETSYEKYSGREQSEKTSSSDIFIAKTRSNQEEVDLDNLNNSDNTTAKTQDYYLERQETIDPKDFTKEALEQVFPSESYIVNEKFSGNIVVQDKTTESLVLEILDFSDVGGDIYIKTTELDGRTYDINGDLYEYRDENHNLINYHYDEIIDEINKKNSFGLPETAENLSQLIDDYINESNVSSFLDYYKEKQGESVLSAVFDEIGLSAKERNNIALSLKDKLIGHYQSFGIYTDDFESTITTLINYEYKKVGKMDSTEIDEEIERLATRYYSKYSTNQNSEVNGEIDVSFDQGQTGDCWLLATLISAKDNAEVNKLLNNMISLDDNGNVIVNLKHVDKTYLIAKEEIQGANELASGDLDARAIEIAVDRYLKEGNIQGTDIDDGGKSLNAMHILFGVDNSKYTNPWSLDWWLEELGLKDFSELAQKVTSGEIIANCSTGNTNKTAISATSGESVNIIARHAYSIVGANDEYVYLKNPHDPKSMIMMTHKEFKEAFERLDYCTLEEIREKDAEVQSKHNENLISLDNGYKYETLPKETKNDTSDLTNQTVNEASVASDKIVDINKALEETKTDLSDVAGLSAATTLPDDAGINVIDTDKAALAESLVDTFGSDNSFDVGFNTDGSVDITVTDKNGNTVYKEENFDAKKGLEDTKENLADLVSKPDNLNTLPENPVADYVDKDAKNLADSLVNSFGQDKTYDVSTSGDGSMDITVKDKKGNVVQELDNVNTLTDAVSDTFGKGNNVEFGFNKDGSVDVTVKDKDGKTVYQEDGVDTKKALKETKTDLSDLALETASSKKLTENTGWNGAMGQSIIQNYGNSDGTVDTGALTKDWVAAGGSAHTYTGESAQNAFSDLQKAAASGNVGSFMNNAGSYGATSNNSSAGEDWSWTGFDVFSTGGNANGGGIVYNEYGQIDFKNSWFSIGGGGSGGGGQGFGVPERQDQIDKELRKQAEVMMQCDDKI